MYCYVCLFSNEVFSKLSKKKIKFSFLSEFNIRNIKKKKLLITVLQFSHRMDKKFQETKTHNFSLKLINYWNQFENNG